MGHSRKEYLVTADVRQLVGQWAERHCYVLPSTDLFNSLDARVRQAIQQALGPTLMVTSLSVECLIHGIQHLLNTQAPNLSVVMMDHAVQSAADGRRVQHYSATRLIWWDADCQCWDKDKIEGPRPHTLPLEEQCRNIAQAFSSDRNVVIVDDGCYDGLSLRRCADELRQAGLNVVQAVVGIRRMTASLAVDFPVHAVRTYDKSYIEDWICERDFILGIPDSGRAVMQNGPVAKEFCAPYLNGFGDMHSWASIPHSASSSLTTALLEISRDLYLAIGAASGRPVLASDIDRWPCYNGVPLEHDGSEDFVACIERVLMGTKSILS